jgi:hypothetical protein
VIATWVAVVLVAVVLLMANAFTSDPSTRTKNRRPEAVAGTTCPLLARAAELLASGGETEFVDAVREASRAALRTLDRSGRAFGKPERLAVQLRYDVDGGDDGAIRSGLEEAEDECVAIGQWPQS